MENKVIVKATNGTIEREETIDISKNEIFKNCSSKESIKRTYEAFWNIPNAIETITVLEIREIT